MSYKLIVSDLDGTLLTPEHRIGEYTRSVLRRLRDQGVELALASGRHFEDLSAVSKLFGRGVCTISSNGAAVHDGDGEVVEMTSIAPECLELLVSDSAFASVHTNLYCAREWLVERPEPELLIYYAESGFSYRVADFQQLQGEPVLKVFFYGKNPELREIEGYIAEQCAGKVTTTFSLPTTLEVMAAGVSKGAALERVCARRGLDVSEVIAFGDGLNDLEMLRTAGTGVLMANADPGLKSVLVGHRIIGTSAEEAVARHLEELYGGG